MKIAYFVDEFPPFFRGGLGTYATEITKQFITKGHSVSVFSLNTGDDPTFDTWEGIEVYRPRLMRFVDILTIVNPTEMRTWDTNGQEFFTDTLLYNILSASKLVNNLVGKDHGHFDILVSHDWLAALAGIIAKRNLGMPFVIHFHSAEQGRNPSGSATVNDIERLAATIADRIVTVSYAMRDELVKYGYPENKIRVIHNGVDAGKYDATRFSARQVEAFREQIGIGSSPMIFFIGRLTWVKGIDSLVLAMPWILKKIPDAKLVIVGIGEMDKMISQMVRDLHLEENVLLHFRMVPEEERILFYAACDIAVFPSKYEPFGIVCTEAMSMGKPVVVGARGTSGFREQVIPSGDGICGFHINPQDPQDIAKYVVKILKDPDLSATMGKNGRERVLDHFTWEIASEKTIGVYQDLADGKK
ncbi:MAG: glycosyltransferase family 4 protein [Methanoregula sp.]|nr:MAG: glycosyltransferase family 4 protein [Methanoregula sp.]